MEQLREEKEFAEGQVRKWDMNGQSGVSCLFSLLSSLPRPRQINFLNSVIVDLQRKNEDLKVKLKKLALAEFNANDDNDG